MTTPVAQTARAGGRLRVGRFAAVAALFLASACSESAPPEIAPPAPAAGPDERIALALAKLGDDPGLYPVRVQLAAAYLDRARATGDWQDVLRAETELLRAQSDQPTEAGLRQLAALRSYQHRFREAETAAREALDAWPQDGAARAILGDVLLAQGRVDEARTTYATTTTGEPDFYALAGVAHCRFQAGDVAGARDDLERALTLLDRVPESATERHARAWALLMRGSFAFETGDAAAARKDYDAALAIEPENPDVLEHLAEWETGHGDLSEALRRYEALVSRAPRPEFVAAFGDALLRAGREDDGRRRLAEAEALWRKLLEAGDGGVRRALALHLLDHGGDAEEALRLAQADLETRRDALACDTLAWALHRLGRRDEAREALGRAPNRPPLRVLREHRAAILGPSKD